MSSSKIEFQNVNEISHAIRKLRPRRRVNNEDFEDTEMIKDFLTEYA